MLPEYRRRELWEKLGLRREELERWDDITTKLYVPMHDGVISQFEGYDDLIEFDWAGYVERYGDIQRLDRILEAEDDSPNRYKLSKQADVLMLFYLLSRPELERTLGDLGVQLDDDMVRRTIEYYGARTSHGSTLSRIVHSWVLSRLDRDQSWDLFRHALGSDISDIQGGTTKEGIHLGAMAGTVDLVQRGFTGLAVEGDVLMLDPSIPPRLGKLSTHLLFRRQWIDLEITTETVTIAPEPGPYAPVDVRIGGEHLVLDPGERRTVALDELDISRVEIPRGVAHPQNRRLSASSRARPR